LKGHLENIPKIIKIQCHVRNFIAKLHLRKLQEKQREEAAELIQFVYREHSNHKKKKAVMILERILKKNVNTQKYKKLKNFVKIFKQGRVQTFIKNFIIRRRRRNITPVFSISTHNQPQQDEVNNLSPMSPPHIPPEVENIINSTSIVRAYINSREERRRNRNRNQSVNNLVRNLTPTTQIQRTNEIPSSDGLRLPTVFRNPQIENSSRIPRVSSMPNIRNQTTRSSSNRPRVPRISTNSSQAPNIQPRIPQVVHTTMTRNPSIRTPLSRNRVVVTPPTRLTHHQQSIHQRVTEIQQNIQRDLTRFRENSIARLYSQNRIYDENGRRVSNHERREINVEVPSIPFGIHECAICMESYPSVLMFKLECQHIFCRNCIRLQISSALRNVTDSIPIKCPNSNSGCEYLITHDTPGVRAILSIEDFSKLERYTLLKMHIPPDKLRYCPNTVCQMPYEFIGDITQPSEPPRHIDLNLSITCFSCNTKFCSYCNELWHEGISCHDYENLSGSRPDQETQNYLSKYCKKCPHCNATVQKFQNPQQEEYERRTGLSGGTLECHHITCTHCRRDFCWTCLKAYTNRRYYHDTCPNSDCIIHFLGMYPSIQQLPLGRIQNIRLIIYEDDSHQILSQKDYTNNNHFPIIGRSIPFDDRMVVVHCGRNGIVRRLEARIGDFTFRQENKPTLTV
jgi:hypothetical protein